LAPDSAFAADRRIERARARARRNAGSSPARRASICGGPKAGRDDIRLTRILKRAGVPDGRHTHGPEAGYASGPAPASGGRRRPEPTTRAPDPWGTMQEVRGTDVQGADVQGTEDARSTAARLRKICDEVSDRFYERADVVRTLVVALLAGQHSLVLGPPGT